MEQWAQRQLMLGDRAHCNFQIFLPDFGTLAALITYDFEQRSSLNDMNILQ